MPVDEVLHGVSTKIARSCEQSRYVLPGLRARQPRVALEHVLRVDAGPDDAEDQLDEARPSSTAAVFMSDFAPADVAPTTAFVG
jgi:hypothetical protein